MTTAAEDLELNPVTEQPELEPQLEHLAKCPEPGCSVSVRFRRTAGGGGIAILDRFGVDAEKSFTFGSNIIPECPNGHGEMTIADDQLPAAEAFALAQEQLNAAEPKPSRLPFPSPPFNYEGCLHEIFEKRAEIASLEVRFKDADDRRKKAKTALDDANEELGKMIDVIQEREEERNHEIARREADAEAGHVDGSNLVRCTWEEQHPGETCPICGSDDLKPEKPRDSVLHIDEVTELLELRSVVAVGDALALRETVVPLQTIKGWSPEERAEVTFWAQFDQASTESAPERPKALGTSHTAGEGRDGQPQLCTQCDAVLIAATDDGSDPNYYMVGWLVGSDCRGRAASDGHHYPEKKKRGRKPAAE